MSKPFHSLMIIAISTLLLLQIFGMTQVSGAPSTTLTVTGPKYGTSPVYVNGLTEFTLTVSETADVWYRWGTYNYTKYSGPFNPVVYMDSTGGAPPLEIDLEGLQTLYYNATGEATKSAQFYVDNFYPVTEIHFSGTQYSGDYMYIESSTQISFTATDVGSGVRRIIYAINNGPYTNYSSPFTVSGLGMQDIYYHSEDWLGGAEPEKHITVSVDNDAPVIQIIIGNPTTIRSGTTYITSSTPISIDVSDVSGVASSSYRIDGGAWTPYTGAFTVTTEGSHTIGTKATDKMGHASDEVISTVSVDSTPPAVSITGAVAGELKMNYGGLVVIQCTDTGAADCTVYYRFGDTSIWNVYSAPLTITNSSMIMVYAIDGLGNTASEVSVAIILNQQDGGGKIDSATWRLYLGIALIVGGILVAISSFFLGRKGNGSKPEKKKPSKDEEEPEKKSKRKR